jgi:ABC-type nitrate/sulfonate/bicarbonate transport system substrate-binding protein
MTMSNSPVSPNRRQLLTGGLLAASLPGTVFAQASASPVTFRYLSSRGGINPHELADKLGYYKGTGVAVQNLGYSAGGPESLFALASRGLDVGSAATAAVINSIAGGNDFVAAYPSSGLNKRVKSIFYVLEDSPIKSIRDIAGKTIAVNILGAHLDYAVRQALAGVGLPRNAAKLVVVPGPQLEPTLRSKQVDIAAVGYWQTTFDGVLVKNGGVRAIFDDTDVLGDLAGGYVVLRRDFIKANPAAARTFVEQAARAADWERENQDEARKVFAEILEARREDPKLAQYWRGFGVRPGAVPAERDLGFWIEVLEAEGSLPKGKIKPADVLFQRDTRA